MPISEKEFQSILEYVKEQLRKQYANMIHENGYGSKAVPQATIEGIENLIKYEEWSKKKDDINAAWCKGYEERAKQEMKRKNDV